MAEIMKKRLLGIWVVLLCLTWASFAADRPLNIVFIPKSSDQVFWDLMRVGVDRAVREEGNVKLTWRGPAHNDDTDSQIRILQAYTLPGVDAILITPTDRARLVEPIRAATAMGIKVIVVDSGLDGSYHSNMVATDNLHGGRVAAKRMAELLNNQGRVMVLRTVAGSASTDERAEGFIAYLKENAPKVSIVADVHGGGATGKSHNSAVEMLAKNTAIDGIFAVNESSTDGMLRALRERGMAGKVAFIGFDSTDQFIKALDTGEIQGLVLQNPQQMGYMGVKAALAAVRNAPVKEKTIYTDTTLVTRENVRAPEIQKLMCARC